MSTSGEEHYDQVLARARAGDEQAWVELYDSLAPQVLGYLRSRGAAEPEEVLGATFLDVTRGIERFEGTNLNFRSWVFVVATSRLRDERRRLTRRPTDPLDDGVEEHVVSRSDVEGDVEVAMAQREVERLLEGLTSEQRIVVQLRVFGELTSQEVADIIDKPVGAVKALYRRGLGGLRRQLDHEAASAQEVVELLATMAEGVPTEASTAVTRRS